MSLGVRKAIWHNIHNYHYHYYYYYLAPWRFDSLKLCTRVSFSLPVCLSEEKANVCTGPWWSQWTDLMQVMIQKQQLPLCPRESQTERVGQLVFLPMCDGVMTQHYWRGKEVVLLTGSHPAEKNPPRSNNSNSKTGLSQVSVFLSVCFPPQQMIYCQNHFSLIPSLQHFFCFYNVCIPTLDNSFPLKLHSSLSVNRPLFFPCSFRAWKVELWITLSELVCWFAAPFLLLLSVST